MRSTKQAIRQPFSLVHRTLVGLGFKAVRQHDRVYYRLTFRTFDSGKAYPVYVPIRTEENGQTEVQLAKAYFENEQDTPHFIKAAAQCKLNDAADYLEQVTKPAPSVENTYNSMAPGVEDMKRLGKEMQQMQTNTEIMDAGMIPDPMQ